MKEIWVDIKDFEGLYQVSNYGRVKSLNYRNTGREKILKAIRKDNDRLYVFLYKNGVAKQVDIHRLVAEAFLPNPEHKPDVHHKDKNPQNNNVENLIWLTKKEHRAEHPEQYEAVAKTNKKVFSKPINQYDLDGNFIKKWSSAMDVERELGFHHANLLKCCKGGYNRKGKLVNITKAYGSIWKYAEDC